MSSSLRVGALLVVVTAGLASADTITFKNGRKVEGHILSKSSTQITIEVPGGQMDLPRSQIASIEESLTIEDQYARRALATAPDDPEALEALASWARRNNFEQRARYLEDQAKGVRLEKRFAQAKTASELLDLALWAKSQGFSTDVRRLAVARALRLEPESKTARTLLAQIIEEDKKAFEAERLKELEDRERAVAEREKALALKEKALREKSDEQRARQDAGSANAAGVSHQGDGRNDDEDAKEQTPPPPPSTTYIILRRGRPKPTCTPLNPLTDCTQPHRPTQPQQPKEPPTPPPTNTVRAQPPLPQLPPLPR